LVSSELNKTGEILKTLDKKQYILKLVGKVLSRHFLKMGSQIRKAIFEHGMRDENVFNYEIDGYGNGYFLY
jgi:meiotically up-regulated gene 157 (Mug157) protein